jgi:hypothetical protein
MEAHNGIVVPGRGGCFTGCRLIWFYACNSVAQFGGKASDALLMPRVMVKRQKLLEGGQRLFIAIVVLGLIVAFRKHKLIATDAASTCT